MQRNCLTFIVSTIIFVISASQLSAMDCAFFGTINNKKVKTIKCGIEKAGTQPYILAQVSDGTKTYGIDFSAISRKPEKKDGYVKVLSFDKGKSAVSYSARGVMDVKINPNAENALYSEVNTTLKSRNGETVKINGSFTWYANAMPEGPVSGVMTQKFGTVNCKETRAKLTPWNDGYRLQVLFLVKNGETANTTIDFPSDKKGSYSGNRVSIQIMHFRMNDGKMNSDIITKQSLKVIVKEEGGKKIITYEGKLKSKSGVIPVSGKFTE